MSKYHAPALDKGLDILEFLSKQTVAQSQAEIASALERSPNEIYRMLVCLDQRGYILKDQVSNKFSLTLKLYQLSHRHSPVDALRKAAYHPMLELSEHINQSCHLSILYRNQVMVISQNLSPSPVSLSIQEGNLFPICQTTSGRVILSILDNQERIRLLSTDTGYQALGPRKQKQFLADVAKVEQQGYIIRESEMTQGVTDYALPLGSSSAGFLGALAVSTLSNPAVEKKTGSQIIEHIKQVLHTIYEDLGLNG